MRSSGLKQPNVTRSAKAKQPAARHSATSSLPWKLVSTSHRHTDRLGQAIGRALRGAQTIALYAPLGAGNTALARMQYSKTSKVHQASPRRSLNREKTTRS